MLLPISDGFILQLEIMQKIVFWLLDTLLLLVTKSGCSTLTLTALCPSNLLVVK